VRSLCWLYLLPDGLRRSYPKPVSPAHFYRMRHMASLRVNQVGRLYDAVEDAIAHVESGKERLPYAFRYQEPPPPGGEETSTEINLKLWDNVSLFDHAVSQGGRIRRGRRRPGLLAPSRAFATAPKGSRTLRSAARWKCCTASRCHPTRSNGIMPRTRSTGPAEHRGGFRRRRTRILPRWFGVRHTTSEME
jgi:hypothetical protein